MVFFRVAHLYVFAFVLRIIRNSVAITGKWVNHWICIEVSIFDSSAVSVSFKTRSAQLSPPGIPLRNFAFSFIPLSYDSLINA